MLKLLALGAIIGSNNLAAALALGTLNQKKHRLRTVFVFAVFEFMMPLLGLFLGRETARYIGSIAEYLAPVLLLGLAVLAFWSAFKPVAEAEDKAEKLSSWRGLILLELGLSLDNLVAGYSLGLGKSNLNPILMAATIACFSASYAWLGLSIGDRAHRRWTRRASIGTGILLTGLAVASGLGWLQEAM